MCPFFSLPTALTSPIRNEHVRMSSLLCLAQRNEKSLIVFSYSPVRRFKKLLYHNSPVCASQHKNMDSEFHQHVTYECNLRIIFDALIIIIILRLLAVVDSKVCIPDYCLDFIRSVDCTLSFENDCSTFCPKLHCVRLFYFWWQCIWFWSTC